MLTLKIQAEGEVIVERQLLRFSENLEAPGEQLEEIAVLLGEAVEKQFDTEGGHASGGWKALTEERVATKARLGLDPRILRATSALFDSLTRKYDPRHIERLSGSSLTFGSTVSYAIFHQSSAPRAKIPYRPPIALTEQDKRNMVKVLQRSLVTRGTGKAA